MDRGMKKGDIVEIVWLDILEPALPAWADDNEIKATYKLQEQCEAKSIGYFYSKVGKFIYIAGNYLDKSWGRIEKIPKGCIKKMRRLK
jgi:hypothetical protein